MITDIMHSLSFEMIMTDRGWKPHYSVMINGRRVCLIGPALASNTVAIERAWREHLADQAKRLQDGARHDLTLRNIDWYADYYDCPATL